MTPPISCHGSAATSAPPAWAVTILAVFPLEIVQIASAPAQCFGADGPEKPDAPQFVLRLTREKPAGDRYGNWQTSRRPAAGRGVRLPLFSSASSTRSSFRSIS